MMDIGKLIDQVEERESISNDCFKKWAKTFGLENIKCHELIEYVQSLHSRIADLESDKIHMKIDADIAASTAKLKRKKG